MKKIEICKLIIQTIKAFIFSQECIDTHRKPNTFVRKRKLSFVQVILFLFFTSKASMNQNLAAIRDEFDSISFPDISKQALSKARQAIHPDLFKELFQFSVDLFYKHTSQRKTWKGLHLFAIDGSKIELPNSKSNFEFFGQMFGYPDSNRKYTQALGSIVYDVLDDYIVHASIHRFYASERSAAIEHLKNLELLNIYDNSVVIFDRGYYSEDMFRHCVRHGYLCLMRLKDSFKISKSCRGDTTSVLKGDPSKNIEDIPIRVIEVILDDGSREYLGTNLFDPSFTTDDFRNLYFYRWPVETKYLELKQRLSMEEFSGATPVSIFQEFFINMLFSNLSALVKASVDEALDENSNPSNSYRYQANRSFIIGRMKKVIAKILADIKDISSIDIVFQDACRCRSQIQPNRKNIRKKKNVGRTHFNNKKTTL